MDKKLQSTSNLPCDTRVCLSLYEIWESYDYVRPRLLNVETSAEENFIDIPIVRTSCFASLQCVKFFYICLFNLTPVRKVLL